MFLQVPNELSNNKIGLHHSYVNDTHTRCNFINFFAIKCPIYMEPFLTNQKWHSIPLQLNRRTAITTTIVSFERALIRTSLFPPPIQSSIDPQEPNGPQPKNPRRTPDFPPLANSNKSCSAAANKARAPRSSLSPGRARKKSYRRARAQKQWFALHRAPGGISQFPGSPKRSARERFTCAFFLARTLHNTGAAARNRATSRAPSRAAAQAAAADLIRVSWEAARALLH